ncbi:MAG: hypothetical protein ACREQV_00515, partial [Candidatus Binatia bacterium]
MTAQTMITLLLLLCCGTFGCAPGMLPSLTPRALAAHELRDTATVEKPAPVPQDLSQPAPLGDQIPALAEQLNITEETLAPA